MYDKIMYMKISQGQLILTLQRCLRVAYRYFNYKIDDAIINTI